MKPRRTPPKIPDEADGERSIKGRLRPVLSRDQVERRVLGMTDRLGLLSPQRNWRLASWFVAFANAPDLAALRRLKDEAEFLASTKGGSALREDITREDLSYVKGEVCKAINWALDEKTKLEKAKLDKKGLDKKDLVSLCPLNPFRVDLLLHRVGNRFEKNTVALDFTGRFLLRLVDLFSMRHFPFARCMTCQGIFARRGRQLYCSQGCAERARPAASRRVYYREYMKKRRKAIRRLEAKAPDLAERVKQGEITLNKALEGIRRQGG